MGPGEKWHLHRVAGDGKGGVVWLLGFANPTKVACTWVRMSTRAGRRRPSTKDFRIGSMVSLFFYF